MPIFNTDSSKNEYDVIICGAGVAGLTLARQLKLNHPDLSILGIDRLARPLPEATFKVGESTVEMSSFYLCEIVKIKEYLQTHQLYKGGLRFFFSGGHMPFKDRPEFGITGLPPFEEYFCSYQLDRGVLENDLRQMNIDSGIEMLEGYIVDDIVFSEDGGLHKVTIKKQGEKEIQTFKARWVIDAMGRRRLLRKKLSLETPEDNRYSASWFRMKGRIDIANFVPRSEEAWHNRVQEGVRYLSTNHLMGDGYWVWLIPLVSGSTSIGIVTLEDIHPFTEYHNYELSYKWLEKNEPVVAEHIKGMEPLDFLVMRNYSYTSTQVFSENRWACVGEAGAFPDPLISPSIVLIGVNNSLAGELIKHDINGTLTPEIIDWYNTVYLQLVSFFGKKIHAYYPYMGNRMVMVSQLLWDSTAGWGLQPIFSRVFLEKEKFLALVEVDRRYPPILEIMQKLFDSWAKKPVNHLTFNWVDQFGPELITSLYAKVVNVDNRNKSVQELIEIRTYVFETLEAFAQVIFLLAVEDTMPEKMSLFQQPVWLNIAAISLDSDRWESDGLFKPTSKPRDLTSMINQVRPYFRVKDASTAADVKPEATDVEEAHLT